MFPQGGRGHRNSAEAEVEGAPAGISGFRERDTRGRDLRPTASHTSEGHPRQGMKNLVRGNTARPAADLTPGRGRDGFAKTASGRPEGNERRSRLRKSAKEDENLFSSFWRTKAKASPQP